MPDDRLGIDAAPWALGDIGGMQALFQVLTAEGRGAIAVIRVWGRDAVGVLDSVFRPARGRPLGETPSGRLRLGRAGIGVGDEVVAVRVEADMPTVEIQCHGGAAAVAAVVGALEAAGAVRAGRDRGDPSPARDPIRAQAMEDLAAAPTWRAAEILLDQADGALSRSIERLIAAARGGGPHPPMLAELDAIAARGEVGTRLLDGWKVVIAGRPNVGKSRLFNAMAGFERSIVDPRPGATRDVVSLRTSFGGWPVELSDTAGERDSEDAIERLGIGRARRERIDADLVLLVLDRSQPLHDVDRRLIEAEAPRIMVANKCDLPPAWDTGPLEQMGLTIHAVSAETGAGLDGFVRDVGTRLVPAPPDPGAGVPFRPVHQLMLKQARSLLAAGAVDGFVRRLAALLGFPEQERERRG